MTLPKHPARPLPSRLFIYARVSNDYQGADPKLDELSAASCTTILGKHACQADRARPVLVAAPARPWLERRLTPNLESYTTAGPLVERDSIRLRCSTC